MAMAREPDAPPKGARAPHPGASFALCTLTVINLLNFMDRYILSALKEPIKRDLQLKDYQTALPTTGMVLVYMVSATLFGSLADRQIVDRRRVLAGGIALWSIATGLAGFAQDLTQLIFLRSLVGIGEAAYGTISLPMLGDFYPPSQRTRVFMIYNLAIPFGGALGFALGSIIGSALGWRSAFLICGPPGVIMAAVVLFVDDPGAGAMDKCGSSEPLKPKARHGALQDLGCILGSPTFLVATAGLVFVVFGLGGFAEFIDSFFQRYHGSSMAEAGMVVGAITVFGGIGGNVLGTTVTRCYADSCRGAYFLVPALFIFASAVCGFLTLNAGGGDKRLAYLFFLSAQTLTWTYMAPMSTVTLASVPVHLRAQACGLQIFFTHALGDMISPPVVGFISDRTGSLRAGLQVCWVALLASGAVWLAGSCLLPPLEGLEGSDDSEERRSGTESDECSSAQDSEQREEDARALTAERGATRRRPESP